MKRRKPKTPTRLEITMSNESKMCDCNQGRLPCTCKTAQQGTGYTAVDMTTAAAQGFRDGAASVVVELPSVMTEPEKGWNERSVSIAVAKMQGFNRAIREVKKALKAQGVAVKE